MYIPFRASNVFDSVFYTNTSIGMEASKLMLFLIFISENTFWTLSSVYEQKLRREKRFLIFQGPGINWVQVSHFNVHYSFILINSFGEVRE